MDCIKLNRWPSKHWREAYTWATASEKQPMQTILADLQSKFQL